MLHGNVPMRKLFLFLITKLFKVSCVNLLKTADIMTIPLFTLFIDGECLSTQNLCLFVGGENYSNSG